MLFRLPWLLLSHGDFELVRGVGTLGRVPRHLDREVAQRGVGRSLERDFRRRVPMLDDRAGGFNGHSFGSGGEIERDVPLEVFAALDTDLDFFRLSLSEEAAQQREARGVSTFVEWVVEQARAGVSFNTMEEAERRYIASGLVTHRKSLAYTGRDLSKQVVANLVGSPDLIREKARALRRSASITPAR